MLLPAFKAFLMGHCVFTLLRCIISIISLNLSWVMCCFFFFFLLFPAFVAAASETEEESEDEEKKKAGGMASP